MGKRQARLNQISRTLRIFGLTDPGDIGDACAEDPLPSEAKLAKIISSSSIRLPPSVTPRFLAISILSALVVTGRDTTLWGDRWGQVKPELSKISAGGGKAASKFHDHVYILLQAIFDGQLVNPNKELQKNNRRQRIDITFECHKKVGIFDYALSLDFPCDLVFFECKNYTDDIGNPEYDQLSGRLGKNTGQFGFVVVRSITNRQKMHEHCYQRFTDKGELILVLDDQDLVELYTFRSKGDHDGMEQFLRSKVNALRLNQAP